MIALGDVVRLGMVDEGYSDATVVAVHPNGEVDIFRPYVHVADFSTAGSEGRQEVIHYIGFERIERLNPERLRLLRKGGHIR